MNSGHVKSEDILEQRVVDGVLITRRLITKSGTTAHLPRFIRRFLHSEAASTEANDADHQSDGGGVHCDGRVLTYVVEDSVIDPRTRTATFTTRNVCSSCRFLQVLETCTFVPNSEQSSASSTAHLPITVAPTPVQQHNFFSKARWSSWLKRLPLWPSRASAPQTPATAQSSEATPTNYRVNAPLAATTPIIGTLCVKQVEVSSALRGVSRVAEQFGMQRYRSNQANASRGLLFTLERLFPLPSTSTSTSSSTSTIATSSSPPTSTSQSSSLVLDVERQLCARFGLTPAQLPRRLLPHERLDRYRALLRRVLPALAPPINA